MTIRFWLSDPAGHAASIATAFGWVDQATSAGETAVLVVPSLKNLDGIIEGTIGSEATKALKAGRPVRLPGGGQVIVATDRKGTPPGWRGGPVLVAWGDQRQLDMVDNELKEATHVLAVPWIEKDVEGWVRTWNVPRLGEEQQATAPLISNYVVENALNSLVKRINKSTGIGHPSDYAATVELFRILKAGSEFFNPDEIRAWLISNAGISPKGADQVREVAQKVLEGRAIRTRDKMPHYRNRPGMGGWQP